MAQQKFNRERRSQLRELLDIQYEKLHEFERAIEISDGVSQRIALRQQVRRDITPQLRETEREYASLLATDVPIERMPEDDAIALVSSLSHAANRAEVYQEAGASQEMLDLLQDIREKLDEPGRSAAAKLKVTLPIVPLIASYELELDTENLVLRSWRSIRTAFERLVQ